MEGLFVKNFPSLFTLTKAGNLGCLPSNPVEKLAREHSWIKADIMVEGFTIKCDQLS